MLSFREFREFEEEKKEEKALDIIRKGMTLQRSKDFWSDFLNLCGNSEGMAALLDVPRDKVSGLSGKIERLKGTIVDSDSKKNDRIIKTGHKL